VEELTFDIFRGDPAHNPIWLEPVKGLSIARQQMEQIAAKKPGRYFLFSVQSRSVLATVYTGENLRQPESELTTAGVA